MTFDIINCTIIIILNDLIGFCLIKIAFNYWIFFITTINR